MQTLITTQMPPKSNSSSDLFVELFCQWALGGFSTTADVRAALLNPSAVHVCDECSLARTRSNSKAAGRSNSGPAGSGGEQ